MQDTIDGGDESPTCGPVHATNGNYAERRAQKPTKKRTKLRAALTARAVTELSDDATALDYVCDWVASGGMITQLAVGLARDMGESCSRSFLSLIIHRLAPDATTRIAEARMRGADALLEQAIEILDTPDLKAEEVPLAKVRVNSFALAGVALQSCSVRCRGVQANAKLGCPSSRRPTATERTGHSRRVNGIAVAHHRETGMRRHRGVSERAFTTLNVARTSSSVRQ